MASSWPPKKGAALNLTAFLYKTDGTFIANPGTLTLKISKDYGDWADSHNSGSTPTEEDSTYGQIKIALDSTDTNADVIDVYLVDNTSGCIPWTRTIYTAANTQDEIVAGTVKAKVDLETIKTQAVTCAAGVTVLASVGTAATATAQTGDAYAIVNSGTYGNSALKTIMDAFATDQDVADATKTTMEAAGSHLAEILAAVITNAAGTDVAADIIALKTVADAISLLLNAAHKGSFQAAANTPSAGYTTWTLYDLSDNLIATFVTTDATGSRAKAT
jgi:hypothetical protein